jgi:hypothetical protein
MEKRYSARYVAKHLGVTKLTVTNWVDRPFAAFPMPVVQVVDDDEGRHENLGWSAEQLPLLRDWLAHRLGLSDPASHWEAVGRGEKHPGGHQDQGALFDTEGRT